MTDDALHAQLRTHVRDLGGPPDVADQLDLFATGALKSMQLLELVNRLEDDYQVRVDERDISAGRLRTIASLATLIRERGSRT